MNSHPQSSRIDKSFNFIIVCFKTVETIVLALVLMPVWIRLFCLTDGIEALHLFCRKFPAYRTEVLAELFFGTCSYDEAAHRGALQQPVQGDLRHGLFCFSSQFVQYIHNIVQAVVGHYIIPYGRTATRHPSVRRYGIVSVVASSKTPSGKRTPDH